MCVDILTYSTNDERNEEPGPRAEDMVRMQGRSGQVEKDENHRRRHGRVVFVGDPAAMTGTHCDGSQADKEVSAVLYKIGISLLDNARQDKIYQLEYFSQRQKKLEEQK